MGSTEYCYLYRGVWTKCSEQEYYDYAEAGVDVYVEKNGPCGTSKGTKPKPKPDPDPNPYPPKPDPTKPKPKNVCLDNYGNEISINSTFVDAEFKTEEGLKAFKEYLKKYYKDLVTSIAGTTDKLDSAKLNDCIVVKLYNSVDPIRKLIIGDYVYDFWKTHVGGWKNSTSKTELEYDTWLKSDSQDNINTIKATKEDWDNIIKDGWFSSGGRISDINKSLVLLYKYDSQDNILQFDALTETDELDFEKIKSDLKGTEGVSYYYYTYPIDYTGEQKDKYPKISDEYQLYLDDTDTIRKKKTATIGLETPVIIKENYFRKFLLEKIREKNEYKTIFVEDIKTPQTSTPVITGRRGGTKIETKDETKTETDIFGLNNPQNSLTTDEAKKNFIDTKGTPVLQNLINKGSRSQNFVDWNNLAKSLGAKELTFKDKNNADVVIDQNNAFNVGVPGQLGNYTEQPFYNVLNITGDQTKNTAKIYTPISITNKQAYLDVKVSIPFCRTQLINYLKDALGKTFSGTPQQRWNRKYEICGCNERGGFDTFKFYRKLPNLGKTTTGREKLDIRPGSSVFTQTGTYENPETGEQETTIGGVSQASPFIPVFNKKLNWKEIKKLITGGTYTNQSGVKDTIDEELIIDGFDGAGSLCSSNKFKSAYPYAPEVTNNELQKESFDKRIDNKLLESIRNKNNKENLVEDVLRRILKK